MWEGVILFPLDNAYFVGLYNLYCLYIKYTLDIKLYCCRLLIIVNRQTKRGEKTMKKMTFTNDYHNSEVTLHVADDGWLTHSQAKRMGRELCGLTDCTCGGIRGKQEHGMIDYAEADNSLGVVIRVA